MSEEIKTGNESEAVPGVEARWDAFIAEVSPLMSKHKFSGCILLGLLTESGEPGPSIAIRTAGALPVSKDESIQQAIAKATAEAALSAILAASGTTKGELLKAEKKAPKKAAKARGKK